MEKGGKKGPTKREIAAVKRKEEALEKQVEKENKIAEQQEKKKAAARKEARKKARAEKKVEKERDARAEKITRDGNAKQGDVQREQEDVGTSLEDKFEDAAKEDGSKGKAKKGKNKKIGVRGRLFALCTIGE